MRISDWSSDVCSSDLALPSSPYHALAQKYLPSGAGSVFTLGLKGGYAEGVKMVESCELLSHLANIGDVRSLILPPASTTHSQLNAAQLAPPGAGPDVLRLAIGLETVDDIIADIARALTAVLRREPKTRAKARPPPNRTQAG